MEAPVKALLTLKADDALSEMKNETNDGFKDGRVSKNQLLSWIVIEFHKVHFKKSLQKIRHDHFDEIAHLAAKIEEIKAARRNGQYTSPPRRTPLGHKSHMEVSNESEPKSKT